MNDVENSGDKLEILSNVENLLCMFRNKYNGISLFHHFASESDIIGLVHSKYMEYIKNNNSKVESIIQMPLLLLSPDDKYHNVALDIAIHAKKPLNFSFMIDLLKDFNDLCMSRMMLGSF